MKLSSSIVVVAAIMMLESALADQVVRRIKGAMGPRARTQSKSAKGSKSKTSQNTGPLSTADQNRLLTCIAVIDESSVGDSIIDVLWDELRVTYPDRRFCLLQPILPGNIRPTMYRPPDFHSDPKTLYQAVNRDDGNATLASDYYSICGIEQQRRKGLTNVALFVDISGSMDETTVATSLDLFDRMLQNANLRNVSGVYNDIEDWITPCLTTAL